MSKLTKKDVEHIAKLSKLSLSDAEKDKFQAQLSSVLGYVEQLNEVDTSGVEPTAQVTGLSNIYSEDEVDKSEITKDDIKKNAPKFENDAFKVPGVFNTEN